MLLPLPLRPLVVLALIATAAHDVTAQNIVANPSFELPALVGNGDVYSAFPGFSLPGWTVSSSVFVEFGTPFHATRTAQGRQSLFLNSDGVQASPANPAAGAWAWQDLATVVGQPYLLTFAAGDEQAGAPLSGPPGSYTSPASVRVTIGAGPSALTQTFALGTFLRPFGVFSLGFTATSAITRLRFDDATPAFGPSGPLINFSPFIDDISVTAVGAPPVTTAPEPATLALLAPGLALVGVVATRRARSC